MEDDSVVVYGASQSHITYDLYKNCEVIALPRKYGHSQMGYTIPKNSSFTPMFTYYINLLIEGGTVGRIKAKYESEGQICPSYEGKPLGLRKCFLVIGALCMGAGLSLVWLL